MNSWHARAVQRLAEMDQMIAQGRGDETISIGGCTDPGGGIVPGQRTVREMASLLRKQINLGLGEEAVRPPTVHHSPWAVALVTSVVGAATGWVIEELARHARKRGRRR